jgi:hypothetical protein
VLAVVVARVVAALSTATALSADMMGAAATGTVATDFCAKDFVSAIAVAADTVVAAVPCTVLMVAMVTAKAVATVFMVLAVVVAKVFDDVRTAVAVSVDIMAAAATGTDSSMAKRYKCKTFIELTTGSSTTSWPASTSSSPSAGWSTGRARPSGSLTFSDLNVYPEATHLSRLGSGLAWPVHINFDLLHQ